MKKKKNRTKHTQKNDDGMQTRKIKFLKQKFMYFEKKKCLIVVMYSLKII